MAVDILDRRLLLVTGKGGTGKTSVTAALALLASQRGRRVLACEVEPRGDLAEFFESAAPSFRPREVQPGLFAMAMSTEEALQEYLRLQLRLPAMARMGPLARAFDFVATAAPGVREILTVGKLAYEARERHYDLVVADAAASGHVVGQLAAPRAIDELVHVGPVHSQTGWMLDILGDPAVTGLVVVTTPEEMPVNETIGLVARLRAETNVEVSAIVVNRVLPELFSRGDEEIFERLRTPAVVEALSEVADAPSGHGAATPFGHGAGGPVDTVLDAARLAVTLRRTRAGHLERLRESIPAEIPMLFVPYLFTRGHGLRTTAQTAEALSAELGY
ncbi:MAG TPA: ArsA family ATPase [Acidimicrobiales bacterium]|nr:ArsA family ATPase [Acidimicrobiales bacterium]